MPEAPPSPLRRVFEELQREIQPQVAAPPPPPPLPVVRAVSAHESRSFELERQQQLADQLRSLEEERVLVKRRASNIAAEKQADAQSETGLRSVARGKLMDDLRDAEGLRRAFVLREVLGTPVGLR